MTAGEIHRLSGPSFSGVRKALPGRHEAMKSGSEQPETSNSQARFMLSASQAKTVRFSLTDPVCSRSPAGTPEGAIVGFTPAVKNLLARARVTGYREVARFSGLRTSRLLPVGGPTEHNRLVAYSCSHDPTNHHQKGASNRTWRSVKCVESPREIFQGLM
jgi:hypothetical protein